MDNLEKSNIPGNPFHSKLEYRNNIWSEIEEIEDQIVNLNSVIEETEHQIKELISIRAALVEKIKNIK